MKLEVSALIVSGVDAVLDDLARLRIAVFREFPYLYDGSLEYERRYLSTYARSPGSVIVVARDGERVVGASSALPLETEPAEVQRPFLEAGFAVNEVFYLAESVLLGAYRGRGLGHAFFDARETRARALGFRTTTFCAVQRPTDHAARPLEYRGLEAFWEKRGYEKREDLRTTFSWRDIGDDEETAKPMTFWVKSV